ncbi:hypothetical protein VPHF86_0290 [Vibrio phage F86]
MFEKFVSPAKIARISKMPDATVLFELRHSDTIVKNVVKTTTHLSAIVIHGRYVYSIVNDFSQRSSPQLRGQRRWFGTDENRDRWLDMSLNMSNKRARFSIDEILMNPTQTRMSSELELVVTEKLF